MRTSLLPTVAFAAFLSLPAVAGNADEIEGIPLVITVVDAKTGLPIPFAAVRETQERELHPVNKVNGQFSTTMLYPNYNEEIPLQKDMALVLEITAASYAPKKIDYVMRKRKNQLIVQLEPMQMEANWGDEPVWQFGRDVPIGGRDLSPEELKQLEAEAAAAKAARDAAAAEGARDAPSAGN